MQQMVTLSSPCRDLFVLERFVAIGALCRDWSALPQTPSTLSRVDGLSRGGTLLPAIRRCVSR